MKDRSVQKFECKQTDGDRRTEAIALPPLQLRSRHDAYDADTQDSLRLSANSQFTPPDTNQLDGRVETRRAVRISYNAGCLTGESVGPCRRVDHESSSVHTNHPRLRLQP